MQIFMQREFINTQKFYQIWLIIYVGCFCYTFKLFLVPLSTLYGSINISQALLGACSSQKEERILHALGLMLSDKVWIESLEVETEKCLQLMSNWKSKLENSMDISEDNLDKDLVGKKYQGSNFFWKYTY